MAVKPLTIKIDGKDIPLEESAKALDQMGKEIRRRARISLTRSEKNASRNLYDSITYDVEPNRDKSALELKFTFPDADYWQFVDQGVKGAKSQMKAPRSPFRFSGSKKSIPTRVIDRWVIRKGLKGTRDEKGKFIPRKTMVFLIARSIYQTGIKPSYFFTKPFDKVAKEQEKNLGIAIATDIADVIRQSFSDGSNN